VALFYENLTIGSLGDPSSILVS